MSAWYLVIYIYAGMMAQGDSVALASIPQPSKEVCEANGKIASKLTSGTAKSTVYVCLRGDAK